MEPGSIEARQARIKQSQAKQLANFDMLHIDGRSRRKAINKHWVAMTKELKTLETIAKREGNSKEGIRLQGEIRKLIDRMEDLSTETFMKK